ncbi:MULTISPECIES: hypothetical protein [Actinosynnema]|uniref:hypothetical protein n=1 Tax=Actinosynnema TaxID=40566 RepID=UPI0020A4976B|nr:hypothetical protein [Actinosynnema pretiosum]MCP2097324.1 hypothetical protein [Actinosynnema pretiosum]
MAGNSTWGGLVLVTTGYTMVFLMPGATASNPVPVPGPPSLSNPCLAQVAAYA